MHDSDVDGAATGRIFLSYSRDERSQAMKVIALLESAGLDVWWDGLLEGGENYLPTTEAALEGADCVVVLWSKISIDSHWVRDEAQSGRERKCLIPVSIDGSQPPLGFRQFQTIDASGWSGKPNTAESDRILAAVLAQCGKRNEHSTIASETAPKFALSRRQLATGGAALVGVASLAAIGLNIGENSDQGSTSLAVIPFANLSGDPEQVWFSGGLSNELRAALARNPRLRVSAPTSSSASDEQTGDEFALGRRLGVANLLRGSVQMANGVVRISAELVQVEDGLVRWADSFDRQFEDVLAVQSEIASTVAVSLIAEIAGKTELDKSLAEQAEVGGTESVTAYEAYLRGQAFYDLSTGEDSDRAALAQFDAGIAADPDFARAHAMRATVLSALANGTSQASEVRSLYNDAIASAQQAIDLTPDLARAHLAKGFALNNGRLDRSAAKPHYDRARELAPGDADVQRSVAIFMAYGEQGEEAQEIAANVLALDPLNARAFSSAGYIALLSRNYPDTIAHMQQALKLNPNIASAYYGLGSAQYLQGSAGEALKSFEKEPIPVFALTGKAIAHHKLGDEQAARASYDELIATYGDASPYQQAQIQAQWGDTDKAITLLDRAVAIQDPGLLFLTNDPMLEPVRDAPGFSRLQTILTA
ncbi:TIR domain-containing protein [Qipengyuania sp. DGS5-3]|uniref:TIR domain-containing protein n=1 Tax=Qipengyuania sp. DGS5-3 TaxID=3349632 RepID=UPI0036D37620